MTYLWWVIGVFLWMLIGSVVLGVDDAFEEPHRRVITGPNSHDEIGAIILGFVIWPLALLFLIARLVSHYIKYTQKNREERKPANRDWD